MLSARTRPLSRGRAFRVRFRKPNARNGTQPEPRLRIILFTFETRHSVGERNGWKISSFRKLEIGPNTLSLDVYGYGRPCLQPAYPSTGDFCRCRLQQRHERKKIVVIGCCRRRQNQAYRCCFRLLSKRCRYPCR